MIYRPAVMLTKEKLQPDDKFIVLYQSISFKYVMNRALGNIIRCDRTFNITLLHPHLEEWHTPSQGKMTYASPAFRNSL